MARLNFFLFLGLCVSLLGGCVGGGTPPVSDRSGVETSTRNSARYQVVKGDTLYSIAWRHQQDFRGLAAANRIVAPYDIFPGQLLVVSPDAIERLREQGVADARRPALGIPARVTPSTPHPLAATQPKPQSGASAAQESVSSSSAASRTGVQDSASIPAKTRSAPAAVSQTGPVTLRWPGTGKRLRGFGQTAPGSPKPSSAISFQLRAGSPVNAAAAGQVVYVGSAVAGYQQFVIVKHNDTWLSAYGFNAPAVVREGQMISAGGTLATLSRLTDGSDAQHELHFEVRRDGVPVDPVGVIRG